MRKTLKFALTAVLAACFSLPLVAQSQTIGASLAGRSVDVAGRGMSGERVELLSGTQVVNSTTTNGLGEWSFKGVNAGTYIVRMNVRGRIAGVRVTVAAGQVITGTMVVVPAATASKQLGSLANLLSLVPAASTATISTVTQTVQETNTTDISPAILIEVLNALPVDDRKAFAAAVVAAVQSNTTGAVPFEQYVTQLNTVATTGTVPATLPPPQNVS